MTPTKVRDFLFKWRDLVGCSAADATDDVGVGRFWWEEVLSLSSDVIEVSVEEFRVSVSSFEGARLSVGTSATYHELPEDEASSGDNSTKGISVHVGISDAYVV
jgi:hypothetical protein